MWGFRVRRGCVEAEKSGLKNGQRFTQAGRGCCRLCSRRGGRARAALPAPPSALVSKDEAQRADGADLRRSGRSYKSQCLRAVLRGRIGGPLGACGAPVLTGTASREEHTERGLASLFTHAANLHAWRLRDAPDPHRLVSALEELQETSPTIRRFVQHWRSRGARDEAWCSGARRHQRRLRRVGLIVNLQCLRVLKLVSPERAVERRQRAGAAKASRREHLHVAQPRCLLASRCPPFPIREQLHWSDLLADRQQPPSWLSPRVAPCPHSTWTPPSRRNAPSACRMISDSAPVSATTGAGKHATRLLSCILVSSGGLVASVVTKLATKYATAHASISQQTDVRSSYLSFFRPIIPERGPVRMRVAKLSIGKGWSTLRVTVFQSTSKLCASADVVYAISHSCHAPAASL